MQRQLLILIFTLLTFNGISVQVLPEISLTRVTPEGGVGYTSVMCIEEDKNGFIWFGTNNALFRYDTREIKRYSNSKSDANSIPINRINKIYNDQNNRLFIATEKELCLYNPVSDNFTRLNIHDHLNRKSGMNIESLVQTDDSTFWITDARGLAVVNMNQQKSVYVTVDNNTSRPRLISTDKNGNLCIVYNDGNIYIKERNKMVFNHFGKGLDEVARSLYLDESGVWIGYDEKGLLCFNSEGKQTAYFTEENGLPSNKVRSIVKSSEGDLWIGTYGGIAILDDLAIKTTININKNQELANHSTWSLYKDSKNNIWIGTWLGGLYIHSNYHNSFSYYVQANDKNSVSNNVISSFALDPDNTNIWISTEGGSLNRLNQKTRVFTEVPVLINDIICNNIKSLAFDNNGTLWIGTYKNGLVYKKKNDENFSQLINPESSGFQVLDIFPVEDGIWVSDYTRGVYFYSFKSKNFKRFQHDPYDIHSISNNDVRQILEDRNGDMWFATQNGLNKLKKGGTDFIHYHHSENNPNGISDNFIYSLYEDNEGILWIGTNGKGLNKFIPETGIFEQFSSEDGLPGNDIYTIIEDSEQNLWLATENGICRFTKKTGETKIFKNLEGVYNNSFNPNAGFMAPNGEVFLGGSNGFVSFKPNTIKQNPVPPKAIITHFYVNNKEIIPTQNNKILTENIDETENLKLLYKENSFSFRFVANNFINPRRNFFKYRLYNFSEEWIETDENGQAIFTNIPPGDYVFEVKACNNDGIWNDNPTQLNIRIIPPVWRTWYAYLFYVVIIVFSILYFRQQTINRQKLKSQIELEKIRRENEEKLHQMKLQFFTNISHEFRTPLTLIRGPVNRLLKSRKKEVGISKQLNLIKNNTDRMLRLVNQIMDFRKINSGKLELKPVHADIVSFCKDVFDCFTEHAKSRNFDFLFRTDMKELKMDFDPEKLDKIIFNVLSNAFKYSPDGGRIELSLKSNPVPQRKTDEVKEKIIVDEKPGDFVEIIISDTGKGIPEENLVKIFERFYQSGEENQGSGIGLALTKNYIELHRGSLKIISEEQAGTILKICLPKKQAYTLSDSGTETQEQREAVSMERHSFDMLKKEKTREQNQDALILIVEDNTDLLNYLTELLGEHFRVSKTTNAKEALEQVHSLFPDIIVSDVMMPGINGFQLCEQVKQDIRSSHIPVILLTALDTVKDQLSGLHSGADAYISKPFNEDLLLAHIDNLLESRKSLRNWFSNNTEKWEENLESLDLDKKLISKAIKVVEANLTNFDFSVEMLATELHLSRTHLHRKLKSLTNQSATEFIRYVRLKNAVKLLLNGKYKVNEIGYAVGFNSHNYFTKSFKKYYGMSPSEFIRENKNFS